MSNVRLDTAGLDALIKTMGGNADKAAAAIAFQVEGKAKMLAPVDTGALKNGIHTEKKSAGVHWVSDSVDYGIFVELGTSRTSAQAFMVPAVERTAADVANIVAEEVFNE